MIEARSLTKRYGQALAVDDLTVTVSPGRVTGFLGPNGAGKSTTMRLILGLDQPTAGTALVNGRPYRHLRHPLREVGALLDATAVHGGRSAYHHLLALARSNGIPAWRVRDVLSTVGLRAVAHHRINGFSLGMKQRLGIAAALLGDPPVLMFDEPLNGLDPEGITWVRALMRELADDGRTVLVSSHLMSEVALTADTVVVIGRGRLLADEPIATFVQRAGAGAVTVRSPQPDALARVLAAHGAQVHPDGAGRLTVTGLDSAQIGDIAGQHAIPLHELTTQPGSLEEAFMQITEASTDYRTADSRKA